MDKIFFGIVMMLIGLYQLVSGIKKSEFIVYRILVAKSNKLWGKNVHRFYGVAGALIIVAGILMTLQII